MVVHSCITTTYVTHVYIQPRNVPFYLYLRPTTTTYTVRVLVVGCDVTPHLMTSHGTESSECHTGFINREQLIETSRIENVKRNSKYVLMSRLIIEHNVRTGNLYTSI